MSKCESKISRNKVFIIGIIFLTSLLLGLYIFKNIRIGEIKDKNSSLGTLFFEKEKYTCKVGESITTMIRSTVGKNKDGELIMPTVDYYYSLDEKVATIEIGEPLDCLDCKAFKISCLKKGKTYLNAVSNNGVKTYTTIEVLDKGKDSENDLGTISFDSESYKCKVGEKFTTKITTSSSKREGTNYTIPTIKSYVSKDTSIATIESNLELQLNCINCQLFKVSCLKPGKTLLETTSSTGAFQSVPITVE